MADRKKPAPSSSGTRKRRRDQEREKLQQYGVDLPEIPGVPLSVIPLQVFALKQVLASIKNNFRDQCLHPEEALRDQNNTTTNQQNSTETRALAVNGPGNSSLVASLVDRVAQATTTRGTSANESNPQQQHEIQKRDRERQDSISVWLAAIHREIKNSKKGSEQAARIPVSALQHLWDIATTHPRVNARRSALHLAGKLLEKSSDARRWIFQDDTKALSDWLDAMVQPSRSNSQPLSNDSNEQSSGAQNKRQWQKEGHLWIQTLIDKGYGDHYPRLRVALQRIEQECPWVHNDQDLQDGANVLYTNNLQTWRSWRDLALAHCKEEERRVCRLLQRCSACFDVLAPRVDAPMIPNVQDDSKQDLDNDDDDEDIAWEDGWEDEEENDNDAMESHQQAVERTLATIQATSALNDGQLRIDMNPSTETIAVATGSATTTAEEVRLLAARKRLTKCVDYLSRRHLPRLSQWIDGLTKSDNLKQVKETGALVEMDNGLKRTRKAVLDTCIQLKSRITSILSSAQRLKLDPEESSSNAPQTAAQSEHHDINPTSNNNNRVIQGTFQPRPPRKKNRVQIRYKKEL